MRQDRNKLWMIIALALGAVIIFVVLWRAGWLTGWNEDRLYDIVQSFGIWAPIVAIGLMILHSFLPLPGEMIAMINGMVFGSVLGFVYTWLGAMAGAYVSFFLSRWYGFRIVRWVFPKLKIESLGIWSYIDSPWSLLIIRLIPLISFNLINYVLGLSSISLWRFTWTTGVGILPAVTLSVIFGDSLAHTNVALILVSGALLLLLGGLVWMYRKKQKKSDGI